MELNSIKFSISNNTELTEKEQIFLLETYRKLFVKMYGSEVGDSLLKVLEALETKIKTFREFSKIYIRSNNELNNMSKNYLRSVYALYEVQKNEELSLLLIRDENNNLIGAGRLKVMDEKTASIPDIALGLGTDEEKREIWKMAVAYVERYFKGLGFEKMYIEIPLDDPFLLYRADELGFKEDPEDIVVDEETRTYLFNKTLVKNKDEEFNSSRK